MKGTFFSKPLEWNIETAGEAWEQGQELKGTLTVKNHGAEKISLEGSGVGLSFSDIKKVQTRAVGALVPELKETFSTLELSSGSEESLPFTFKIPINGQISDKKTSFYLTYGKDYIESQLQIKVNPKELFSKVIGLLDTFYRFKQKDLKSTKKGIEFKLIPPTARDMANIESLLLLFSMKEDVLSMKFDFQVKRLDTSSITTKINKESVSVVKELTPKDYSLGRDMINQDKILKTIEEVINEVKMKAVF